MVTIETKYNARCYTEGPVKKTGITIHWWDKPENHPTYEGSLQTLVSGSRETSAHLIAEAGRAACLVDLDDISWACGNWDANVNTVSIECNPRQSDGDYQTIAEVIKWVRSVIGDVPLYPHNHWTATDCPGTYDLARLDQLSRAGSTTTPMKPVPAPPKPVSKPLPQPSIAQLATDVIAGKYGNGDQRVKALGGNYNAVMAEVNRRLGATPAKPASKPAPKPVVNIGQLAADTIAGKFGNGDARIKALGANYNAVMAEVNRRLGAAPAKPAVNISALADAVLRGEYGDGADRQRRLGANYAAVQAEVNRRFS